MLAQLCSGHQHVIDPSVDPTCPKCGEGQHTLEHRLIDCPALAATRLHLFGSTDISLN